MAPFPGAVLLAVNCITGRCACQGESAIWIGKAGEEAKLLLWEADDRKGMTAGKALVPSGNANHAAVDAMWAHHEA